MARSPRRLHERSSFYKYMTASTARAVLSTRGLRWSSPTLFNDPFDTPRELAFGVATADITRALALRLAGLIERPPGDLDCLNPKARLIVESAQGVSPQDRAAIIDALRKGAVPQPGRSDGLEELRELWKRFVTEFRILCLTEEPASASMWSHYAGGFSGCVLELGCLDDLDSPWLQAKPVAYTKAASEMFNADELAEILIALRAALRACGLDEKLTWYQSTRHTFASHYVRAGGSLTKLAVLLGHLSVEVTQRYAHLQPADVERADVSRVAVDLRPGTGHLTRHPAARDRKKFKAVR